MTPWVRRLLWANAAVYALSVTVFTGPWFRDLLAFAPQTAGARPWTFVTYMFVHAGFLHLAFCMLMLAVFGPRVEERMGGTAFLGYYLLCGLGAPVAAFAISMFTPLPPFVGSAAAVFGVAVAFAAYWPNARIFVFPVPAAVPVRFLIGFLLTLDLLPLALGTPDGVARVAHLGGLVFGFLYLRGEALLERSARAAIAEQPRAPVLVHHHSAEGAEPPPVPPGPPAPATADPAKEMDRLLDKISQTGLESLTPEEHRFLHDASRQLRRD